MQFVPLTHPVAGIHYVYRGANHFAAQYHEALARVMKVAPQATSSKAFFRSPAYASFKSEIDQHYSAFRTMADLSREDVSHAFRAGGVPAPVTPSQQVQATERLAALWREQVDSAYHDTVADKVSAMHDQWITSPAGEVVFSRLGERVDQIRQAFMSDISLIEHQRHNSPKAVFASLSEAGNAMQGEIITALQTAEKSLLDSVVARPPLDAAHGYMAELVPMLPDPSALATLLQAPERITGHSLPTTIHHGEGLQETSFALDEAVATDWAMLK